MMPKRFDSIDALRGLAMVWMTVYHFCFDLNHLGWLHQDLLTDPRWTLQRTAIVSLFLFCAGLGQAVAVHQGQSWPRFWRRWSQVALGAVLVSLGSWWMFPASYIYFGVLHGIALMLIVVRLTAGWGAWQWWLGGLAIALKFIASYAHTVWPELAFLDQKMFNWLGLIGHKPRTEDYVPLLPWLGVMLWGLAAGTALRRRGAPPRRGTGPVARPLATLGRWSLSWYMLHQPVLIGALLLAERWR